MPRDDADALLTVAQAATLLGVHPNTIRAWTDAGRLTAYRINAAGRSPLPPRRREAAARRGGGLSGELAEAGRSGPARPGAGDLRPHRRRPRELADRTLGRAGGRSRRCAPRPDVDRAAVYAVAGDSLRACSARRVLEGSDPPVDRSRPKRSRPCPMTSSCGSPRARAAAGALVLDAASAGRLSDHVPPLACGHARDRRWPARALLARARREIQRARALRSRHQGAHRDARPRRGARRRRRPHASPSSTPTWPGCGWSTTASTRSRSPRSTA